MSWRARSENAKKTAEGRLGDALKDFGEGLERVGVGPLAGLITLVVLAVVGLVVLL